MIEKSLTGLFNNIALPRVLEAYRNAVFEQLYCKLGPVLFESVCWGSEDTRKPPEQHRNLVVFPGEERFLIENKDVAFTYLTDRKAVNCSYHRSEMIPTNTVLPGMSAVFPQADVKVVHYCRLDGNLDRPLLCRVSPIEVRRIAGNGRKVQIVCERNKFSVIAGRYGTTAINQMLYNVANLFIPLWNFLTDAWWEFYLSGKSDKDYRVIGDFTFSLTDDMVVSQIRGASPIWRTEILSQIVDPQCEECSGTGIEFWDHVPVLQRRFDLCRTCVLPKIGIVFGGLLVDPSSKKILTQDGTEYRGDKA